MNNLEYFCIRGEIDFLLWQLEQMLRQEKRLSGIEKMIDEATGYDKAKRKEAEKIIAKINKLKAKLEG